MAVNLNSVNQAVNIGLDISQTASQAALSVSAWIYTQSNLGGADQQIMSFSIGPPPGTSTNSRFSFEIDGVTTPGALDLGGRATDAEGQHILSSSGLITEDAWHHVVGCIDYTNSIHYIYIDGVLNTSGAPSGGAYAAAQTAATNSKCGCIGAEDDASGEFFDGFIEDARLYQRLLSAAEVATIYATRGADSIVWGLALRYPLFGSEGGSAAVCPEVTGNRPAAAGANSPTFAAGILNPRRRYVPNIGTRK